MPRYVSPGRTPSPSRSPSRTSRDRPYTDGVYSPTSSASHSPSRTSRRQRQRQRSTTRGRSQTRSRGRARTPSSDYYYSDSGGSRSRSRSRSRSTARTAKSTKSRIASALDTSNSTGKEKAENVLKTSLVMLGAIGAASYAAHKFWPKGITYGDKDDWETASEKKEGEERNKVKGKLKEGRDEIEGREGGGGGGRGGGTADPERVRYIEERYRQRPRLPPSMEGDVGSQFWEKRERLPARRQYVAAYADPKDDGRGLPPPPTRQRIEPAPPPPPTGWADPGDSERDLVAPASRRRIAATTVVADKGLPAREDESRYAEPARSRMNGAGAGPGAPLPPPPAPVPPRSFMDSAPLVVPAGASRRSSSGRSGSGSRAPRYYVDGDTIVVPSSGESSYVIQRDAPPGRRLRQREVEKVVERVDDRGYYR
ncbi:hypothetical protein N0V82_010111 [Gnomoniopsis sp. IMI 355080]|nr:hypothetical protein N0V82_010111 [Gnomoniopsis sp. IMI 355080]